VCQTPACRHSFILEYSNYGCHPGIKAQIVDRAVTGSGIRRDTARVLKVSQDTVIETLKKEPLLRQVNARFLEQMENPAEITVKLEKIQDVEFCQAKSPSALAMARS
jgi:transposase-like protein